MSMDFIINLPDIEGISAEGCEAFLKEQGIELKVHPDFSVFTQTGFLPFCLRLNQPEADGAFLTGFELDVDQFDYLQEIGDLDFEPDVNDVLCRCKYAMNLSIHELDALELLAAYAFSLYVCSTFEGVFHDLEAGQRLSPAELRQAVEECKGHIGESELIPFEQWER